jgi:hypothetical protein
MARAGDTPADEMTYDAIPILSMEEVEASIDANDTRMLAVAALSASLHGSDAEWSSSVCRRLAIHENELVRGNALLALGHMARLGRALGQHVTLSAIEKGLQDSDSYVRGQAEAAADDCEHFLGWRMQGQEKSNA